LLRTLELLAFEKKHRRFGLVVHEQVRDRSRFVNLLDSHQSFRQRVLGKKIVRSLRLRGDQWKHGQGLVHQDIAYLDRRKNNHRSTPVECDVGIFNIDTRKCGPVRLSRPLTSFSILGEPREDFSRISVEPSVSRTE
jgi:hypothetical protein